MNIIKKFTSFASSSWNEFSDFQESNNPQRELVIDGDHLGESELAVDLVDDDKFNVQRRKSFKGFFNKRFSKKKLTHVLDDPRSPTVAFKRTPLVSADVSFDHAAQGMFLRDVSVFAFSFLILQKYSLLSM